MSRLRELIADRIRTSGAISFAEYMELSLYHPELGYYARAAQKTGRAGDFFTSVDVGPMFGALLAKQFGEMWRVLKSGSVFDLVEAGAGSGRLSRDILDAAQRHDPEFYSAIRLSLVEQSPAARAAHVDILGPHAALLAHSSAALPGDVSGVIFANELLDALPTHVVVMAENGLREVFVDVSDPSTLRHGSGSSRASRGTTRSGQDGRLVERLEDVSTPRIAEYLARAGAEMRVGWRAEVNLAAEHWMTRAADSLRHGFLVVIDYGHDERELYSGSHAAGTLTPFKKHSQFADFLQEPGETDITAHVDLTAVTRAAERSGLDVIARLDQTYFLLGLGVTELEGLSLHQRLALKTLLLPGGLGSTHKVLIFGRGVGKPALKGCSYRVRLT
ncbi:MAG: SAM-dependent methyltransferase [Acidobacteria bacterium]|nr:MAG: SAM-dependent methyltransferase [Acidobacteriota bacterium]